MTTLRIIVVVATLATVAPSDVLAQKPPARGSVTEVVARVAARPPSGGVRLAQRVLHQVDSIYATVVRDGVADYLVDIALGRIPDSDLSSKSMAVAFLSEAGRREGEAYYAGTLDRLLRISREGDFVMRAHAVRAMAGIRDRDQALPHLIQFFSSDDAAVPHAITGLSAMSEFFDEERARPSEELLRKLWEEDVVKHPLGRRYLGAIAGSRGWVRRK